MLWRTSGEQKSDKRKSKENEREENYKSHSRGSRIEVQFTKWTNHRVFLQKRDKTRLFNKQERRGRGEDPDKWLDNLQWYPLIRVGFYFFFFQGIYIHVHVCDCVSVNRTSEIARLFVKIVIYARLAPHQRLTPSHFVPIPQCIKSYCSILSQLAIFQCYLKFSHIFLNY